jgi:hypothetical protein
MDNTVPGLLERHFPMRTPPIERKPRPVEGCMVCCKKNERKETVFWCPDYEFKSASSSACEVKCI